MIISQEKFKYLNFEKKLNYNFENSILLDTEKLKDPTKKKIK